MTGLVEKRIWYICFIFGIPVILIHFVNTIAHRAQTVGDPYKETQSALCRMTGGGGAYHAQEGRLYKPGTPRTLS